MSVSSQGYESNTQLLPPNITAYSQLIESTESIDTIIVPVTSLIQNPCSFCFYDSMICEPLNKVDYSWKVAPVAAALAESR